MNILYVHRTQGQGVEGVHIGGIVNALRRMGNNVDIVSPLNDADKPGVNNKYGKIFKSIPELIFEIMEIGYNIVAYQKISKKFKLKEYSFIYERFAFLSFAGLIIAKRFKVPLILEVNFTTYTPLVRKRSKIFLPLARYIERLIFRYASAIFVVSSFLKKQLISIGVSEGKIFLTTNAVDEQVFGSYFDANKIKERFDFRDNNVIGYVGGFYHWHGLELLLNAVKIYEQKGEKLCLLLVGEGPMKASLKSIADRLQLKSKMVFPGMVAYGELPRYITAMDICVLPDFNNYGSPVKIFEYMAMGRPVVAPRIGPLEDVINSGENGLLFEQQNATELAGCIEKLLNNSQFYNKIAERAKKNIFENHLWRNNAEKIVGEYKKLKL